MRKRLPAILLVLFASLGFANAQNLLTLEQCLETAMDNNLQIQQAENSRNIAEVSYVQSKYNFLPNLNGSISLSKGIGTQVDNFTQQIAQSPTTAAPGFSTSVTVFNGFTNWNTMRAREADLEAAQHSISIMKNSIRLNVVLAFFQVQFDKENLKLANQRLESLEKQYEKLEKQLNAGLITPDALVNLKSQLATERVNQINLENQVNKDLLSLVQYLDLNPEDDYDIVVPPSGNFSTEEIPAEVNEIFQAALSNLPEFREKQMRIISARYGVKNARAGFMPTISATFGGGSFFSSNARPLIGFDANTFEPIYGQQIAFDTQIVDNFGSSIGLTMTIPIFNRYQVRQGYNVSQIQLENALLDLEIQRNTIYKQIQQATLDARASRAKYIATLEQLEALEESHALAKTRYESGLMDFYSYYDVLNNKSVAERELVSAKYDYILKLRILDIYQGKPLTF